MADPIDFPDAEAVVIDHLEALMEVPVHTSVPNPRPDRFLVVTRAGGALRTMVSDEARIVTEAWGLDDQDSAELAGIARSNILAMRGLRVGDVQVYRVTDQSGPARDPDPDSGASRYSTTQSVALRGSTRASS